MYFIQLVVIIGFIGLVHCNCPVECVCTLERSECWINTCSNSIPEEYTEILNIHGYLCRGQVTVINSQMFSNTLFVLHDTSCRDIIHNCL